MTFSHSENDTPSNLHARRAHHVVCPLGMHRITPFLIALPERTTLKISVFFDLVYFVV